MRAVVISDFGGPEKLELVEDHPVPEPGDGQVLVKVARAGINFADTHARENSYLQGYELPLIPGGEVAGEVDGRRVVALTGTGGYAEYAVAPEVAVFPLPDGVSDAQALAIVIQGLSAWHLLKTSAKLAEGESVVVHAAAGGVGTLAVQLAKRYGAGRVIATASTEKKRALALELGADVAIDPNEDDLKGALREANGGAKVDIVLEMAGGRVFDQSLRSARAVRPPGHLRPGVARVQRDLQRRAHGAQPGGHRVLARPLLRPPGDGGRALGGAVRAGVGRRASGRRGRDVRVERGPPRA